MIKRFTWGLGLITIIFVFSGLVIFRNLDLISTTENIKEQHEAVLRMYLDIMYKTQNAEIELYRHQTGEKRDIDIIAEDVLQSEKIISAIKQTYSIHKNDRICSKCHVIEHKLESLDNSVESHISEFKRLLSIIVRVKDEKSSLPLEQQAIKEAEAVIDVISGLRQSGVRMNEKLEESFTSSQRNSRYSIVIAIFTSVIMSLIIITFIVKSLSSRVKQLVEGIQKATLGDYSTKVDITSNDEIGFIANSFNTLTTSLGKAEAQKDSLLKELKGLNDSLEERICQATEELTVAHDTLLRNETLAMAGAFASGVTHKLSTSLSTVMGYIDLIKLKVSDESGVSEYFDVLEKEIMTCKGTLKGMLEFVKVPDTEKSPVDINSVISELVHIVSMQRKYTNYDIKTDLDAGISPVMSVPGELSQAFMNIIVNAFQAMPEEGELRIATSPAWGGNAVLVSIGNTGSSISESDLDKIFKPFYTTKKSGTGLGLSISYGIVKNHNGDIKVKSDPKEGVTFDIYLPVIHKSAPAIDQADSCLDFRA